MSWVFPEGVKVECHMVTRELMTEHYNRLRIIRRGDIMNYEHDKFLYTDEDDQEQYIMFIHPITKIEPLGKLGNECMVYTEHAEYHVQWLKDRERTRVVTLKGPENRWDI